MSRKGFQFRRGFTLVELLVVIAIISTLMGLLLPAVQNAREAGRRNTCMNNIGQLSKATIAYDGTKSVLPGWRNAFPNPAVVIKGVYWPIVLLPHLERGDLYRIIETGSATGTRQFTTTTTTATTIALPTISIFQCPSAPPSSDLGSTTAYAANAGSGLALAGTSQAKGDGVFLDRLATSAYAAARNSLDSISSADGTTNTVLFAEKTSNLLANQATWAAVVSPVTSGSAAILDWDVAGDLPIFGIPTDSTSPKPVNTTTLAALGLYGLPSSTHPGGVIAAFADGHVQYVRDSIECWVYAQLISSDSKYNGAYYTNSSRVRTWLGVFQSSPSNGVPPYLISEADFK